jgi:hypothetical protein
MFSVELWDKVHSVFILDYKTDEWSTRCGRLVTDPTAIVLHQVVGVSCPRCQDSMRRFQAERRNNGHDD